MKLLAGMTRLLHKDSMQTTKRMARWLGVLYIVEGVVALALRGGQDIPVQLSYAAPNTLASQTSGHTVLALASHRLFDVRLVYVVGLSLLVAGVAHLLLTSRFLDDYAADERKGNWLLAASGISLLVVALATASGVFDIVVLTVVLLLSVAFHLFAARYPGRNQTSMDVAIATLVGGGVLLLLIIGVLAAALYGNGLSAWVYGAYLAVLVAVAGWFVAAYAGQTKRAIRDQLKTSTMPLLWFVQSVVAWLLIVGAFHS